MLFEKSGWALGTEALSATWLYLDDQEMLVSAEGNHYKQVELGLFPGWLTSRFLNAGDHSHVYLYWQLPEETHELIPTRYLGPPKGTWQ